MDTEQADKACLISYLFGPKAANLWGHPVIFPKLLEGWGVRARYHCYTLSTLSKHAICRGNMEPGSAGSHARQRFGWFMQKINANHEHILWWQLNLVLNSIQDMQSCSTFPYVTSKSSEAAVMPLKHPLWMHNFSTWIFSQQWGWCKPERTVMSRGVSKCKSIKTEAIDSATK